MKKEAWLIETKRHGISIIFFKGNSALWRNQSVE